NLKDLDTVLFFSYSCRFGQFCMKHLQFKIGKVDGRRAFEASSITGTKPFSVRPSVLISSISRSTLTFSFFVPSRSPTTLDPRIGPMVLRSRVTINDDEQRVRKR